jgi:hypothetical protein
MSETAAATALKFALDGQADQAWVASDQLLEELSGIGLLAFGFAGTIRRRHHVLVGFKDNATPTRALIYLGQCGNGSLFHESFGLGAAGRALIFCEPSDDGKHALDFAPVPLTKLRFVAGLLTVGPSGALKRLRARKFTAAERKELADLESGCSALPLHPFYGDGAAVAEAIEAETRLRLRAAFAQITHGDTLH